MAFNFKKLSLLLTCSMFVFANNAEAVKLPDEVAAALSNCLRATRAPLPQALVLADHFDKELAEAADRSSSAPCHLTEEARQATDAFERRVRQAVEAVKEFAQQRLEALTNLSDEDAPDLQTLLQRMDKETDAIRARFNRISYDGLTFDGCPLRRIYPQRDRDTGFDELLSYFNYCALPNQDIALRGCYGDILTEAVLPLRGCVLAFLEDLKGGAARAAAPAAAAAIPEPVVVPVQRIWRSNPRAQELLGRLQEAIQVRERDERARRLNPQESVMGFGNTEYRTFAYRIKEALFEMIEAHEQGNIRVTIGRFNNLENTIAFARKVQAAIGLSDTDVTAIETALQQAYVRFYDGLDQTNEIIGFLAHLYEKVEGAQERQELLNVISMLFHSLVEQQGKCDAGLRGRTLLVMNALLGFLVDHGQGR